MQNATHPKDPPHPETTKEKSKKRRQQPTTAKAPRAEKNIPEKNAGNKTAKVMQFCYIDNFETQKSLEISIYIIATTRGLRNLENDIFFGPGHSKKSQKYDLPKIRPLWEANQKFQQNQK